MKNLTIVTDRQLQADGVYMRDRRELTDLPGERVLLTHTRWYGDQEYQVTKTMCVCVCGEELEIKVKTEMTEDDIKQFELMWEENWNLELATITRS